MAPGTTLPVDIPTNHTCDIDDRFLYLVVPVGYSVIFILGLLSNLVALCIFFLKSSTLSITVYMKNLVIADLLLVLCLPIRIYYHNKEGPFFLCRMVGISFYVSMYASIVFLSLISLDRYLKIIKPVQVFRIHRAEWSRKTACIVWAVFACSTFLLLLCEKGTEPCDKICFHFHRKRPAGGAINLVVVALFFILFLVFVCFYGTIGAKLSTMTLGGSDLQARSRKKKIVVRTYVVPAIFTLCFFPYHVVRVPYILSQMDVIMDVSIQQQLHMANELMLILSAVNSCLDPVIYFFLCSAFRKTVRCAVQGRCKLSMNERAVSFNRSANEF
ncbi:G protein-coupled receptor 34 like [Brienomyrus brachyistius]|uniref:G protein-coupled receptor 34 like n=1 Tax=Brienomyrus brachyistius TaxID=42636 RepID=UPI0020B2E8E4|nr:G protein-coupled receptor 34 like [Brienomyrus brachyistius]XP_048853760.1 G protein-coupled receptor 34 like [Brienomyrus brachyistius]XP_048853761.1 G protein-coupled receptor 34 like [Brienomyrus brachyistius]XP_048853762.1 G protein-coupled receptor 34 like [Brienomyrus brachyistius]XP_048853763.1 G protein-coupled receptor 34 like [Brienomyrus brachyistius]